MVNPAISSVLAAAFWMLWRYQPHLSHLGVIAFAYIVCAFGFLLQCFALRSGLDLIKLVSNASFAIASFGLACAVLARYGRRIPYTALALSAGGGFAGFCWFLLVQPDLTWRLYAMNFGLGGLAFIVAAELRRTRESDPAQRVLFVLSLLSGLNFLIRPLLSVAIHGPYDSYEGFSTSFFWTTAILTHAILSLLIAMTLITATVVDVLKALKSDSQTDALSGLLNRRGFEDAAAEALRRSERQGLPAAIVVADLDHFKSVNDTFGHAVGDRVIVAFAERLRAACGVGGIAGRIGGEEFAVLLTTADLATARLFAESVRSAMSQAAIAGTPSALHVTASFGVAALEAEEALPAMMRRADEALYRAKKGGRDMVRLSYPRADDSRGRVSLADSFRRA